jgi:hypothetical protein
MQGEFTPFPVLMFAIHLVLWPQQIKSNFMALHIITTEDLTNFKEQILSEIQEIYDRYHPGPYKTWLKSKEVRKLLQVSPGTLQTLRLNGTLKYSKVGGIIYYDQDQVQQLLLNSFNKPKKVEG